MGADSFKVSVVIPAYNESSRIAAAIAAIRSQSEPPHEIVVVDDGSKDDTAQVASALGVRVQRQPNGGIASARNTGAAMSTGNWIAFCDADDVWKPDFLARARGAHELRPEAGFIFADHCTSVAGKVTQASMFAASPSFPLAGGRPVGDHVLFFERHALARALANSNFIVPSTAVARRELIVDRGIRFAPNLPSDATLHVAEDIEWYLRLLVATDGLGIDRVMLTYVRHAGSVSDDPGRVNYGNTKLGEIVAAHPGRYADGVAEVYAAQRREHVRRSAIDDIRTFRFTNACAKLDEAQRMRFRTSDALLRALATVASLPGGRWCSQSAQKAWRSALRPAVRAITRRAP